MSLYTAIMVVGVLVHGAGADNCATGAVTPAETKFALIKSSFYKQSKSQDTFSLHKNVLNFFSPTRP